MGQKETATTNKYRVMIYGPKTDDTYVIEFRTAAGEALAISSEKASGAVPTSICATNTALSGIPAERVRFHTCYGINEGPRLYEANLDQIIEYVLKINAGSFSFEAANPRHEHEYHLFERVKVPDGKVLCPGVVTHASNIVEHPEWIAERLIRFAKLVGRENVMAGADCGFSSQALYRTEVHPTVVWEKFKAMRQGAEIATKNLWKRA
jgi:5-methyltetrahydropteroyltriglutamate--homocysteine methyltransferase